MIYKYILMSKMINVYLNDIIFLFLANIVDLYFLG